MNKYKCSVIAGDTEFSKEDIYGENALDALHEFIRYYVPKDKIIVTIEVVDVERTVRV